MRRKGPKSLKRQFKKRIEPTHIEADYATKEKPIGICRNCKHHTSACLGTCSVILVNEDMSAQYCDCPCPNFIGGHK